MTTTFYIKNSEEYLEVLYMKKIKKSIPKKSRIVFIKKDKQNKKIC